MSAWGVALGSTQAPVVSVRPGGPVEFLTSVSVGSVFQALFVLAFAWFAVRFIDRLLSALGDQAPRARFFFKLLSPTIRFMIWGIATFAVISIFSPSRDTLLAVLASLGIALGLGAQDLVKNILGGLVILLDRPYQLGDRVKIGEAYGEIDHIGLRSTKLTTPDDTRVTIPNSEILTGKAWNANSGVPDCQVVTDLFLPVDSDPVLAAQIGAESAYSSPYLLLSKPVVVLIQDRFAQRPHLMVRIKAYVYDHRFEPRLQSDITMRAKREFLRHGLLASWTTAPEGA
jgi:MscS family membrane protein